ncbi:hypothetical protein [uncultured Dysosmobacter sp.]|nr:hypothetical protein [uncultured Dysosmobacter sp.]
MAFLRDFNQPAAAARFALSKPGKLQTEKTGYACLFRLHQGEKNTFYC